MNRRTLLAGVGTTTAVGFAGCIDTLSRSGTENGDELRTLDAELACGDREFDDYPRIEEPPHAIPPEHTEDFDHDADEIDDWENPDGWNADRLGSEIDDEPSIEFEEIDVAWSAFRFDRDDIGAAMELDEAGFWAGLVVTEEDKTAVLDADELPEDQREMLEAIDLAASSLVVVQSGLGSGSYDHRWVRAEPLDCGVHLHGYYTHPYERSSDATDHVSLLALHHEDDAPEFVKLSLTISEDVRVNFDTTDGAVQIEHRIGGE